MTEDKWGRFLKAAFINLLLPLLPMLVRFIIHHFSTVNLAPYDPNDILYYSFVICLVTWHKLQKYTLPLLRIARFTLGVVCVISIILIVLILTEVSNQNVILFSIICGSLCLAIGGISEYVEASQEKEEGK